LLLYSYEDVYLGALNHRVALENREQWVGRSRRRVDLLLLRDPFNLFASRIRSGLYDNRHIWGEKVVTLRMAMRIWKQHAREFLGERNLLPRPKRFVSFNEWMSSQEYRRQLASDLGLQLKHQHAPRVPHVAGGSSFDGTDYDGQPDRMRLDSRWEAYIDDPSYRVLFDEEVLRLSGAIFGRLPAAAALSSRQGEHLVQ
jgi:hypothetical protein